MACSGIAYCESRISSQLLKVEKTRRLMNLAIEIINYIKKQTYGSSGQNIKLKIGIHTGKVIAGIIGHHKPQFSLIGDTINTTSRICSNAKEQSILLSEEAHNKLNLSQIQLNFVRRIITNVKGKGDLVTYEVDLNYSRKKSEHKSLFKDRIIKLLPEIKAQRASSIKEKEILQMNFKPKLESKRPTVKNGLAAIKEKIQNLFSIFKNLNQLKQNKRRFAFQHSVNDSMLCSFSQRDMISKNDINQCSKLELNYEWTESIITKEKNILKIKNKYFLTFAKKQEALERDFHQYLFNSFGRDKQYLLMFLFILYLIQTFALVLLSDNFLDDSLFVIIILRAIFILATLLLFFFLNNLSNKCYFKYILLTFLYYGSAVSGYQMYNGVSIIEMEDIQVLEISFIYIIVSNCNLIGFLGVLFFGASTLAFGLVALILKENVFIEDSFFIFGIIALNSIKVNLQTRYHVQVFNTLQHIEKRKNEQNDLVSQLLPYHVLLNKFNFFIKFSFFNIFFFRSMKN